MSLLERLTGATPEKLEQKGDRLLTAGRWGEAKLAFEEALDKLARRPSASSDQQDRVKAKIIRTRNALAHEHRESAEDLMAGGYWAEAREMLVLAIEVSAAETDRHELAQKLRELDSRWPADTVSARPDWPIDEPRDPATVRRGSTDEDYFLALCHTLPDPVRLAYQHYGEDFKVGYIALNQGHFDIAARHLERAHRDAPGPNSHIPLELATAYLNLNRPTEARELLETYQQQHPDALPAYQLLCEAYWAQGEFRRAIELLDGLPSDLSASLSAAVLRGDTLERAGRLEPARDHYRRFIETYGWETRLAHRLARVSRELGATEEALQLYQQIVENGRGCGARIAARIRHEYAELCFEDGTRDIALLEQYLTLAREIPARAALYYDRVAHIYARQGHDHEARRFRNLARQIEASTGGREQEDHAP